VFEQKKRVQEGSKASAVVAQLNVTWCGTIEVSFVIRGGKRFIQYLKLFCKFKKTMANNHMYAFALVKMRQIT